MRLLRQQTNRVKRTDPPIRQLPIMIKVSKSIFDKVLAVNYETVTPLAWRINKIPMASIPRILKTMNSQMMGPAQNLTTKKNRRERTIVPKAAITSIAHPFSISYAHS